MFGFFKNTAFLVVLCVSLAISTASLLAKTVMLTAEVATLSASAAGTVIANRKAIASAVVKAKAKARIRRYVAAIPLVGIAAVAAFEAQDYLEWQDENPDGSKSDYACDMAEASASVVDEVLQDLPEKIRPSNDYILSYLPDCENPD
ncbi:hypothetical protein [Loktanella sp. M215]|uniref:hypothetical protein n=1 Tax=Loktanella sp. M215 TaxID=2675431 RepID=UPI001F363DC0|nr:hypothetical protein [Loktanella sp. M215]MCF7698150.1 hypothetical protein [Loktanella sp. M215]